MSLKSDPDIQLAVQHCFLSTKICAKTLFGERFYRSFTSIHDEIFSLLDDPSKQKVAIAAPRGWGKSTVVNLVYPAKKILFREKKFIVPVSCTASQAEMRGEDLKSELLNNRVISDLFGPMKSERFSKEFWITSSGIAVMPRGAGQQVRGILHIGGSRPDLILVDDLEDSESVKSEEQRKKLKEWFYSDLVNSVNRDSKDWKVVVIGTILHEDSLLSNLLEDPTWSSLKIELCDDNYHSLWPDYMSDNDIRELAEDYASKGLLHLFAMEFRNTVIPGDAPFQQGFFRYYDESKEQLDRDLDVENVVIVDPAKTANMKSAYSAICGIGVNLRTNSIYLRDLINERLHPDELYERTFDMCRRLRAQVLAVEVTGLNEFISYPFKTWITKEGLGLQFVELQARGGTNAKSKEDRVRALVPFYRKGLVYHNKGVSSPLEQQLISFPRSKFWDSMDCFAYIVELLDKGDRYFFPRNYDQANIESEYADLDYEPELENWRVA